jgi:uncharacterized protein YndB with AHSA1/START domain/DNA-binding transcriptional ArsR family regulator
MPASDGLSAAFAALADPTRRSILTRLRTGPLTVGDLAARYAMSRPAVSQHLAVLERAGLVARDRRGQWRECRLETEGLDAAAAWIEAQRAGWVERFDALDEHLEHGRGDPEREGDREMTDTTQGFSLARDFDATPEQVWRAWTDADEAARWWHPRGMTTPRESVAIDARVGGRYEYTMVDDTTGERYVTGGTYREVEPFSRLVFTWGVPDDDAAPIATVTIEAAGDRTRMTFDLRGVEGSAGDGSYYDGWVSALDVLGDYLVGVTETA